MNADVEELLKDDAETRRLVESLRRAPQAHVFKALPYGKAFMD